MPLNEFILPYLLEILVVFDLVITLFFTHTLPHIHTLHTTFITLVHLWGCNTFYWSWIAYLLLVCDWQQWNWVGEWDNLQDLLMDMTGRWGCGNRGKCSQGWLFRVCCVSGRLDLGMGVRNQGQAGTEKFWGNNSCLRFFSELLGKLGLPNRFTDWMFVFPPPPYLYAGNLIPVCWEVGPVGSNWVMRVEP
jgi:hypothetical protein